MSIKTEKGNNSDLCYENSGSHLVEFFSKAGSLFVGNKKEKPQSYYGGETTALDLFKSAWSSDNLISMKLLFWLRDCRGGAGNRSGFRSCLNWLAKTEPEWVIANINMIPEYGRWDDLLSLYNTPCEQAALSVWSMAIIKRNGLACKWADRKDNKLRKFMKLDPKTYRKILVFGTKVVEQAMCSNDWSNINYEQVPSVAMSRYAKAFGRHDTTGFNAFKSALEKSEARINASALFPHDCVRTVTAGDSVIADKQFEWLPNYLSKCDARAIAVTDLSGSMGNHISGMIRRIDVSLGLGLYCSDKIDQDNPFYRKFLAFSGEAHMIDWKGMTFSDAVKKIPEKYSFVENTNIYNALMRILKYGTDHGAKETDYPTALLIISDMQFDGRGDHLEGVSSIDLAMAQWKAAGIKVPKIVFWNLAGYAGDQAKANQNGIVLVSGFSPSILKTVFIQCGNPHLVMMETIKKYYVIDPNDNDYEKKAACFETPDHKSDFKPVKQPVPRTTGFRQSMTRGM